MQKNKRLVADIVNNGEVIMTLDNNLLHAEFGALDRGNITDAINWGIYSNRGSISFIDNIGFFNDYNINYSEIKSYEVRLYLKKNNSIRIATFNIEDCEYDDETRRVDIELSSKILKWQNNKNDYVFANYYEMTLSSIIERYLPQTVIYGEDASLLETGIYCTFIEPCTDWEIMNKICQASMCRIYENAFGDPIVSGSFPLRNPIIVDTNNIIDIKSVGYIDPIEPSIDVTHRIKKINKDGSETSFNVYNQSGNFDINAPKTISEIEIINGAIYDCDVYLSVKPNHKILDFNGELEAVGDIYNKKTGTYSDNQDIAVDYSMANILLDYTGINILVKISNAKLSSDINDPDNADFYILTRVNLSFRHSYFEDEKSENKSISSSPNTTLETNELIQLYNSYNGLGGHYFEILSKVSSRYGKGIECVECECLLNSYYDEDGNLVYDGNKLQHFEKYDTIIPYVMRKGRREPFRLDENGNPMVFRIIGIEYSYDGLLKQKLHLHQERQD